MIQNAFLFELWLSTCEDVNRTFQAYGWHGKQASSDLDSLSVGWTGLGCQDGTEKCIQLTVVERLLLLFLLSVIICEASA
jgi:hypothetical protein